MYNVEIRRIEDGSVCIEQEVSAEHKECVILSTSQLQPIANELLRLYKETKEERGGGIRGL